MSDLKKLMAATLFVSASLIPISSAQAGESLVEALQGGKVYIDARYRYEFVEQANRPNDAKASTLRTRIGAKTGEFYGFSILGEIENVSEIGKDLFNNTINGRGTFPVVVDVKGTEVNQLFLQYTGLPQSVLRVGRQVIAIDNQRFVGHVGWRQNNQTFDAVYFTNTTLPDTKIIYGYLQNVNRIFGDDSLIGNLESDSHIINVTNNSTPLGTVKGYAYLLDFEDDTPGLSSQTYGVSVKGKRKLTEELTFKYYAEYARQSDYGANPTNYDADYYHLAPALQWRGITTTVGYEVLGSDNGVIGFSTPLATGHVFNGFADQFLATPVTGLEDLYVDVTYKVKGLHGQLGFLNGLLMKFQYHDFSSEQGSVDFGTEFDVYLKKQLNKHVYLEAKYADFNADSAGFVDVTKFIFGAGFKY